jgi:hypothetical protein
MGLKVYQHLYATYLSTDVVIDGKRIPVVFSGGTKNNPVYVPARYTTRNIRIQEEIEKRPDYGSVITIFCQEKEPEPEKQKEATPDGFMEVKDITTAVAAKSWLLDHFSDLKHEQLKNTAMVKDMAKLKKVVFVDL